MTETFMLPDGRTTTRSCRRYLSEWRKFNRVLARAFPEYKAAAFDPDVQLVAAKPYHPHQPFVIPGKAARKIVSLQLALDAAEARLGKGWMKSPQAAPWPDDLQQQAGRHLSVPGNWEKRQ